MNQIILLHWVNGTHAHAHTQNDHVNSEVKGFINSKIFE